MTGDAEQNADGWRQLVSLSEIPILLVVGLILLPYWIYEDLVKFEEGHDAE